MRLSRFMTREFHVESIPQIRCAIPSAPRNLATYCLRFDATLDKLTLLHTNIVLPYDALSL